VSETTRCINQEPTHRRKTDSPTKCSKPLHAFVRFKENVRILVKDSAVDIREWTPPIVPFDIGSLKIRLDAEDEPLVPLPVVANLAATNESAWIHIKGLRRKIKEGCDIRERIEMSIAIARAEPAA